MNFKIMAQERLHHWPYMMAFKDGLARHGVYPDIVTDNAIPDCDLLIMWSARKKAHIKYQKNNGKNYLILERG